MKCDTIGDAPVAPSQGDTTNGMTEGRLSRGILRFSLPLVLSNLLQVLFNMSDVAVVGRFAGSTALGAVGSTATLVTLFTGIMLGFGAGVNAMLARHLGAQDTDKARRTVHTAFFIALLYGAVLTGGGLLCARRILLLLQTRETYLPGATLYLRIYLCGMPAVALFNFGNAVLSAQGDTRRPLIYLSIAGALNVVLNLFTVIVLDMSIAGVAIASITSQYLSALFILLALFRERGACGLSRRHLRLTLSEARELLLLSIPAGLQNAIFAVANLFIQSAVNSLDDVMVAGNSAAANADALIYDVMAAFYTACTCFMAQNYGARKRERVLRSFFISMLYAFGIGVILGGLLYLFGRPFLSLFTTEVAVVEAGMKRISIMAFSYAVSAFMDGLIAASRGLGRTVVPTVIVILGSCVFRVVWVYTIFAHFRTIPSLYLLYIFSWSITALAEAVYFIITYRRMCRRGLL